MRHTLPILTVFVTSALSNFVCADGGNVLEAAAANAARLCIAVDAASLDACGNSLRRSSQDTQARRALLAYYLERNRFLSGCEEPDRSLCLFQAEWYTQAGINAAASRGVAEESSSPSILRSDMRR